MDFTEDQGLLVVYTPLLSIEIRDINLSSYKTSCWDRGPCCLCFHINCGMHFLFINLLNNSSTFFISEYHKVSGRRKGGSESDEDNKGQEVHLHLWPHFRSEAWGFVLGR